MFRKPYNEDGSIRYFELLKIMLFISFLMALFTKQFESSTVMSYLIPSIILYCLVTIQAVLLGVDIYHSYQAIFTELRETVVNVFTKVIEYITEYIVSIYVELKEEISIFTENYKNRLSNNIFQVNNVIRC